MAQHTFGTNGQIQFAADNEYYEALGFLAKNDGTTSIVWEHNEMQGAWGSEGRIQCYQNILRFPAAFSRAFSAGNGGAIIHRINCNEYVQYIATNNHVVMGPTQNAAALRGSVPPAHVADFDRGLLL